ncbi:MAG: biopolymer transporter ExbD [Proteobacteria bacterium]|nr:biopolymer transporter ExbD [Pseudomonadota bacterium]MBU0968357.1 biopolymer transporter ExbD [Pseudomonadota bacterium]MBU4262688.1 biopolymer transporter ExbD [Pseudomonadota bacterium]MBU4294618.1 biopolymer transporter ExbD [Pseudomonadota bacterium]MCG2745994.1 biopolymer transporter ExbD [Desulfobulbaceae bacterium]
MFTFSRRSRPQVSVPLTSLIDVVFLLLVYFLLTSNFVTQEAFDIRLPQVDTETPAAEQLVVITLDRQGNFYIGDIRVDERLLAQQVRRGLAAADSQDVVIKADRDVRYDRVIAAMDIAKENGASRLHLAIEHK